MSKPEIMEKHGILSRMSPERWISKHREGGPDAHSRRHGASPGRPRAELAAEIGSYIEHWNTRCYKVGLKGLSPAGYRAQSEGAAQELRSTV